MSTEVPDHNTPVNSFESLAASRRKWIDDVLHPWCQQATLMQLRQAEIEWTDIAGRVDADATLWTWAWERFAVLTHPELSGVNETHCVRVAINDGTAVEGYPDSRQSVRGILMLVGHCKEAGNTKEFGPFAIDTIDSVELLAD